MPINAAYIVPHPPLIVPEVGKGQEKAIQSTIDSYHMMARQIAGIKPDTIILISPHSVMYADYIHISPGRDARGSLKQFGAPAMVHADYDTALVDELCRLCDDADFPAGTLGEKNPTLDHGTLVPLHFVNQYYTGYRLVRCSISGLSRQEHYRFGMMIQQAVDRLERSAVFIASGDLSHKLTPDGPYGFAVEGPELDAKLTAIMRSGNFGEFFKLDSVLCERGAECGLGSFVTMAGALDQKAVETQFLSYEGPFGVGYAVCGYRVVGDAPGRDFLTRDAAETGGRLQSLRDSEDAYVRLARQTLERYVTTGKLPKIPDDLPDTLKNGRAGVFVSIKKDGRLRGCIGTTEATKPSIAEEIMQNAISSGTRDPRFSPVRRDELDALVYSVDVLSPAEPISDASLLDVLRYGVIVSSGRKRGLLLPNLEGVDRVEDQIRIACEKAGIRSGEPYTLERFEVVRHQ